MSTQEVPKWLDDALKSIGDWVLEDDDIHEAAQTILSHMIDKQAVFDAVDSAYDIAVKRCEAKELTTSGATYMDEEIRQALNLNGDE